MYIYLRILFISIIVRSIKYIVFEIGILDSGVVWGPQDKCGGDIEHVGIGEESGCSFFAD